MVFSYWGTGSLFDLNARIRSLLAVMSSHFYSWVSHRVFNPAMMGRVEDPVSPTKTSLCALDLHSSGWLWKTEMCYLFGTPSGYNYCSNNGGCSHLCLPRPGGFTCRCPDVTGGRCVERNEWVPDGSSGIHENGVTCCLAIFSQFGRNTADSRIGYARAQFQSELMAPTPRPLFDSRLIGNSCWNTPTQNRCG